MKTTHWSTALAVGVAFLLGASATGQELFTVTGAAPPGSVTVDTAEGSFALATGAPVPPGVIRLTDGARGMFFEGTGTVTVAFGPGVLRVNQDELTNGISVDLESGRVLFACAPPEDPGRPITVFAQLADQGGPLVEIPIARGRTYIVKTDEVVELVYLPEGDAPPATINVADQAVQLQPGERLLIDVSNGIGRAPLGDWLAEQGFERAWTQDLGVASAQIARGVVEANLFNNIIAWDRYAGATYVASRLRTQRFRPEIRTTVQTITTVSRSTQRQAQIQTQPFDAANEVPLLSPAALSVQNTGSIGAGVTAIRLNASAAQLLASTGSRGLGFRGLRHLAIPGFTDDGIRTIGPAGLGAQR